MKTLEGLTKSAIAALLCIVCAGEAQGADAGVKAITASAVKPMILPDLRGIVAASDSATENAPANIYVANANGVGNACYLTHDGNWNRNAAWSYDGTKIVWNLRNGVGGIWIMDSHGNNKTDLTAGASNDATHAASWAFGPAFSPNGEKIVYSDYFPASATGPANPLVGIELWTMNLDGSDKQRLTKTTVNGKTNSGQTIRWSNRPAYSPNGKTIVYSSTQSGNAEIWVINPDGTDQRQLTFKSDANGSRGPDANFPSYSPDGTKIAYACGWETMYTNICVMNADGFNPRKLTHNADDGLKMDEPSSDEPAWSPDGARIMFDSNQYDPTLGRRAAETWVMNADGTNMRVMMPHIYGEGRNPWLSNPVSTGGSAGAPYQCMPPPPATSAQN